MNLTGTFDKLSRKKTKSVKGETHESKLDEKGGVCKSDVDSLSPAKLAKNLQTFC